MMKKTIITFLLFSLWAYNVTGQKMGPQQLSDLKESPAGIYVLHLLNSINGEEPVSNAMVEKLFSKKVIEKNSLELLTDYLKDIRQTDGQLLLYDAIREERFKYQLKLKSSTTGDWLDMMVSMASSAPYKIEGFQLGTTEDAAIASEAMLAPSKTIEFKPESTQYLSAKKIGKEADKVAKAYENMGWFSGIVLVAHDKKPIFEKAYGYADLENKKRNTLKTKFRIGSINKTFTDVLIHQMVEKGKLSYDDKLARFDLGFHKDIANQITLQQILTHTAGFSDIFIPEYMDNIRAYKGIDDILPLLLNSPLIYEPGTEQEYSNYGYIVLGAILEKLTGQQFKDLIEDRILQPLGMKDTHYAIAEKIEGEAKSYRYNLKGEKIDHTAKLEYCTPDGGMYATAKDLLTFFNAWLYTEQLISDETKVLFMSDYRKPKYTWKEMVNRHGGGFGDAGGGPGVSAFVGVEFGGHYTTIILANTDGDIAEKVADKIRMASRGRSYKTPALPTANHIWEVMEQRGTDYLVQNFSKVLEEEGHGGEVHSGVLNTIGYGLMREGAMDDAIRVFTANIKIFPKEANPYDSLGEAYYKQGDKPNALKYYRKALAIDPGLPSAKQMLAKLEKK